MLVFAVFPFAVSVEYKRVMIHIEVQHISHHILNILNSGIAKLFYFVAVKTNQVIMLSGTIRFFILCEVFAKLMTGYQVTFYQKVKGVINRGTAHLVFFILHGDVQIIHIKVVCSAVDFFKYGVAFRSFS